MKTVIFAQYYVVFGAMLATVTAAVLASIMRIAKEYERAVDFRLGRMIPLCGPGLFFGFPLPASPKLSPIVPLSS